MTSNLTKLIADNQWRDIAEATDWADRAYQVADGMLEARERNQTNDR